ncbi:flagellar motor switch protein FliM [Pelagivirga sediminicola]|uniref:Flagellar motor switch protein FliM n=2 Tax=Pelagivirga sediminicola TaxID=2170575 RepID=A0A2T7G7T4_9RHOB|nr:flagellar motor switch protein FliM [Pelagivirga sediminicola]
MEMDGGNTVIHRMARASREEFQARAMSPAKALRLALAQASDAQFDLAMVVTTVEQVEVSQTALRAEFGGGGLLVLLDGPKGARGAVRMDHALLTALIEVQTTGRISGRPPGDRAVTRTDAAIAAPLIDAALDRAETQMSEEAADHWICGYRFGVMMEDARGMALALSAAAFHVFRMTVELGDDGVPGSISFLLPVPQVPVARAALQDGGAPRRTLEDSAMDAPVSLEAVLGRVTVPLTQLCGLAPGDLVPFQADRPLQIRLEVSQKHVVALGRLGQLNGGRAVRLIPAGEGQSAPPRAGPGVGDQIARAVSAEEAAPAPVPDAAGAGARPAAGPEMPDKTMKSEEYAEHDAK